MTVSPIRDTSDRYGVLDSTKCFTPRSAYFCRAAATSSADPTSLLDQHPALWRADDQIETKQGPESVFERLGQVDATFDRFFE